MLKKYAVIACLTIGLLACTSSSDSKNQPKKDSLLAKENELLKKENELLKKEDDLNKKSSPNNQSNSQDDELDFMMAWKGKYPYEVKPFENPILKKRLGLMLGNKFNYLKSIWEVETPIEIENKMLYAFGMQAHSGGDPGGVLMADISKNVLYVGIRKDTKASIYSEDGSTAPKKLKEWAVE